MIHWDPSPEIFTIPGVNWPILWYGVLFALGFAIGFPIFVSVLYRYFLNRPEYLSADILKPDDLTLFGRTKSAIAKTLNGKIYNEESDRLSARLEALAARTAHPGRALARLTLDFKLGKSVRGMKSKSIYLADKLTVYMVAATVIGARLGHFLFYEKPSDYLKDPWEIFRIWEGGLASHGAIIAIIIALILFSRRIRDQAEGLNWIRLLDFVSVPAALIACCIRVGNFFNQEVLGTTTTLPWGVVFGHPADHSLPAPRHPAQLYEALFYCLVFVLLFALSRRPRYLLAQGKLIGLFLVLVFTFRFLIEFLKIEQSRLISPLSLLTMGQLLSIPAVVLGIYFYCRSR